VAQLALGFDPVTDVVTMVAATGEVDLERTVSDLEVGGLGLARTPLGHRASLKHVGRQDAVSHHAARARERFLSARSRSALGALLVQPDPRVEALNPAW